MVFAIANDFDYKSDECDEQTANELYISAFFNKFGQEEQPEFEAKGQLITSSRCPSETPPSAMSAKVTFKTKRLIKRKSAGDKFVQESTRIEGRKAKQQSALKLVNIKVGGQAVRRPEKAQETLHSDDKDDDSITVEYDKKPKKKRRSDIITSSESADELIEETFHRYPSDPHSLNIQNQGYGFFVKSRTHQPLLRGLKKKGSSRFKPLCRSPTDDSPMNFQRFESNRSLHRTDQVTSTEKKRRHEKCQTKALWHIIDKDREELYTNTGQDYRFMKFNLSKKECSNCRQVGHIKYRCPLPTLNICYCCGQLHNPNRCKQRVCSVCKLGGHLSDQCPLAVQLSGIRCRECNLPGHGMHSKLGSTCPDLWRRYHRTTTEGPPVVPSASVTLSRQRVFCTNCGLQGHSAAECPLWRHDRPRPSWVDVVNYEIPPKSSHGPSAWPMGSKAVVPIKYSNTHKSENITKHSSLDGRGTQDIPSARHAKKRTWNEANKNQKDEMEGHRAINRRKGRRRIAKVASKGEFCNNYNFHRHIPVTNFKTTKKFRSR